GAGSSALGRNPQGEAGTPSYFPRRFRWGCRTRLSGGSSSGALGPGRKVTGAHERRDPTGERTAERRVNSVGRDARPVMLELGSRALVVGADGLKPPVGGRTDG